MIPRSLHLIWIGPKPLPTEWLERWDVATPGWEHCLWRMPDGSRIALVEAS